MAIPKAKRVLVFRPSLKLVGVFASLHATNQLLFGDSGKESISGSLQYALSGKQFTYKGFYLRYEHPDVLIELEDIGVLTLAQYDFLCDKKDAVYVPAKYIRDRSRPRKRKLNFSNKNKK